MKERIVLSFEKTIAKELEELECFSKTEPYNHKVGTSERTKAVIEPRLI